MEEHQVDALLVRVIAQARAAGIPVPESIDPHVRLNTRAVARLGCCRPVSGGYIIEISARLLLAGEEAVAEVLAHEVLHTCRGCRNHGERWKGYAARMNARWGYHISRTGTWEAMGLPEQKPARYVLVCTRCGTEFVRARASSVVLHPERYRCRCGGQLALKQGDK